MRVKMPVAGRNRYAVSVDPGLNGTGLAIWGIGTWGLREAPREILTLYGRSKHMATEPLTWDETAKQITGKFKRIFAEGVFTPVTHVYIEMPEVFDGSAKGYAANVKGDLFKLSFLIGNLAQVAWENSADLTLYPVTYWKGQLPKAVVIERIKKTIPTIIQKDPHSHMWDAIGIGLFAKGFF